MKLRHSVLLALVIGFTVGCAHIVPFEHSMRDEYKLNEMSADWVRRNALGLAVDDSGTCYVPFSIDETGVGVAFFRDGRNVGRCKEIRDATAGIAVNDRFLYVGQWAEMDGEKVYGVMRFNLAGGLAPWEGNDSAFLPVSPRPINSMAVHGNHLYVLDDDVGMVRVFNMETMAPVRGLVADRMVAIAVVDSKFVWGTDGVSFWEVDSDKGVPTGRGVEGIDPIRTLGSTPAGHLVVTGPKHHVLVYDVSDGMVKQARSYGEFQQGKQIAADVDAEGNVYIVSGMAEAEFGMDLVSTKSNGKLRWRLVDQAVRYPYIKELQFYVSHDIKLEPIIEPASAGVIRRHKLVKYYDAFIREINIVKDTPCRVPIVNRHTHEDGVDWVGEDYIEVNFDPENPRNVLRFTSSPEYRHQKGGRYYLAANFWEMNEETGQLEGLVKYGDRYYRIILGKDAFLKVDERDVEEHALLSRTLPGSRFQWYEDTPQLGPVGRGAWAGDALPGVDAGNVDLAPED